MRRIICSFLTCLGIAFSGPTSASEPELMLPDHVGLTLHQHGLTVQKSPTLYFDGQLLIFHDSVAIRLTVIDSRSMQLVAVVPLHLSEHPHLKRVQLGDYGIELQPEVPYEWYVTESWNLNSPRSVEVTRGSIIRIDPKNLSHYRGPCGTDTMWKLIDAKIWYDAFACVNELIEAYPDDITLHDLRDELLGKCRHPYDRMPLVVCHKRW